MKFTEEHQWLRVDDEEEVVVGITIYAAEQLGDVLFVELPEEGAIVSKDDEVAVIESEEESSTILAPVDGEITEVNEALVASPGALNDDPQGEAWLFKIQPSDRAQMDDYMEEDVYQAFIR